MINKHSRLVQEFWENGRSDSCPILDFHGHMGGYSGSYLPACTPEGMINTMNKCNTVLTCFCGMDAIANPPIGVLNDMDAAKRYPEHFKIYHVVASPHLDFERDLAHFVQEPDLFVGFKFHCQAYKIPLAHISHQPYWEYADRLGLPVLCHTWGSSEFNDVREAEKILEKYHNLKFIAGHSFFDDWKGAAELVKKYPNIYLELTAVTDCQGALDLIVDMAGSQRILFGTDLPWFATHNGVGAVLSARISDEDRKNIFHRNGKKLLDQFNWFEKIWENKTKSMIEL